MAMTPAKCTQCGANIQVDDTKEAGICESCGTAFITEKAINNYNITNNYHADVVNIINQNDDFEIKAGILIKYKGASDTVIIPDVVKVIGTGAFANLKGLTSVSMSGSVQKIETRAFSGCDSLKSISLSPSIKKIPSSCFFNCTSLTTIKIPTGCVEIDTAAFEDCTKLSHIVLPNSLQIIQDEAFSCCRSLESIVIPASVKKIQGHGNKYCEYTKTFSNARSCFDRCSSLKKITFEGSNTEISCSPYIGLFDRSYTYQIEVCADEGWKNQNQKKLISTKSGGCYVATAVYGSYDCPEVWTLRRYRDYELDTTWYGRAFIKTYYAISPIIVKWFGNTEWFKKLWKSKLDKMVSKLQAQGYESTRYNDKY